MHLSRRLFGLSFGLAVAVAAAALIAVPMPAKAAGHNSSQSLTIGLDGAGFGHDFTVVAYSADFGLVEACIPIGTNAQAAPIAISDHARKPMISAATVRPTALSGWRSGRLRKLAG